VDRTFDVAVIGLGGAGLACAELLSASGLAVVGLDQHELAHARGSSHGVRLARVSDARPGYLPLLLHAHHAFGELARDAGERVLDEVGHVAVVPEGQGLARARIDGPALAQLLEPLSAVELAAAHPLLLAAAAADRSRAFLDRSGRVLHVEAIQRERARRAEGNRASLRWSTPVVGWHASESDVRITTASGDLRASHLVVAGGAWTPGLVAAFPPLALRPSVVAWFALDEGHERARIPTFTWDAPGGGAFYGCHVPGERWIKVGSPALPIELASPEALPAAPDQAQVEEIETFTGRRLRHVGLRAARAAVCMTSSTDAREIVVAPHPAHPNVTVAAGLSGFGFKLTPTIAEAVRALVTGDHSPVSRHATHLWSLPSTTKATGRARVDLPPVAPTESHAYRTSHL